MVPRGSYYEFYTEYSAKETMMENIKGVFSSFGYKAISTPTFEYLDLFKDVPGTINEINMFKFIDITGEVMVLRPDVTIPIVKMVAKHIGQKDCLKLFYYTQVFRSTKLNEQKRREFTQMGIEFFGDFKEEADAEIIVLAIEALKACKLNNFRISIGNSLLFKRILNLLSLGEEEEMDLSLIMANKNLVELGKKLDELNIDSSLSNVFMQLPLLYNNPKSIYAILGKLADDKLISEYLKGLEKTYSILHAYDLQNYITFDLCLLNNLDYYCGTVLRGYVNDHGKAVLEGGRYDNLVKEFNYNIPATGFGIDLDEIIMAQGQNKGDVISMLDIDYRIVFEDFRRKEAYILAKELREQGLSTETMYCESISKAQHIHLAQDNNVKQLIIFNDEKLDVIDIKKNTITKASIDEYIKWIKNKNHTMYLAPIH